MKIEEAIEMLKRAQNRGVKSIVLAHWEAVEFGLKDDDNWEGIAEYVEDEMDWSNAHDRMCDIIENDDDGIIKMMIDDAMSDLIEQNIDMSDQIEENNDTTTEEV